MLMIKSRIWNRLPSRAFCVLLLVHLSLLCSNIFADATAMRSPVGIFWIEENLESGSVVGQLNAILEGQDVKYTHQLFTSLARGEVAQFFRIDRTNGTIYASRKIDREALCDGEGDGGSSSSLLESTIQKIHILSNTRRKRSTKDDSSFSRSNMSSSSNSFDQSRSGRSSGGFQPTMQAFTCQVEFQVHISLTSSDAMTDSRLQTVRIMIADVNDNEPRFYPPTLKLKVLESSPLDAEIRLPQAYDPDSGAYSVTDYRMTNMLRMNPGEQITNANCESHPMTLLTLEQPRLESGFQSDQLPFVGNYFLLKTSQETDSKLQPILKQIRPLDREQTEMLYFCLIATDGGENQGTLRVQMELLDANDNVPQWLGLPYKVSLPECEQMSIGSDSMRHTVFRTASSGLRVIHTLRATDADSGRNGQISYRLAERVANRKMNHRLQQKKLPTVLIRENQVLLASSLDYETLPKFRIPVEAVDGGGLMNFTEIQVTIEDCNDHNPTINVIPLGTERARTNEPLHMQHTMSSTPILWIPEEDLSRIGLATIMTQDLDQQDQGQLTCRLESSSSAGRSNYVTFFELQPIKTPPLDAQQLGIESYTTDRSPPKPSVFTLYKREGMSFDREKVSSITLTVVCSDGHVSNTHDTRKLIYLRILDSNDNAPRLVTNSHTTPSSSSPGGAAGSHPSQIIYVNENEPYGTRVGKVHVTDADEGNNAKLHYEFLPPSSVNENLTNIKAIYGSEMFELDSRTGELITHVPLDRETNETYYTYIRVSDAGTPSLSTVVLLHIVVLDVNDSPPQFVTTPGANGCIVFNIPEANGQNRVHGRLIGQLKANDADNGPNQTVGFDLVEGSLSPHSLTVIYRVTSHGKIYADGLLDREQIGRHHFTVRAIDGGLVGHRLTASAVVIVNLLDINDCAPEFTRPLTKSDNSIPTDFINLTVTTPPGTVLYQAIAIDMDDANSTDLHFALHSAKFLTDYFTLRPHIHSRSSSDGSRAEASVELILANSLTQLPSIRTFSRSNVRGRRMNPQLIPKEYFVYIIVKDSVSDPSHSTTARLQIHVYPEHQVVGRQVQHNPNESGINRSKSSITELRRRNLQQEVLHSPTTSGTGLNEHGNAGNKRDRAYRGMTVILIMAIVIICVFLGVFCLVAYVYIRGGMSGVNRRSQTRTNYPDGPDRKAFAGVRTHGDIGSDDNGSTSDQAVYWELMQKRALATEQDMLGTKFPSADFAENDTDLSGGGYVVTTGPLSGRSEKFSTLPMRFTQISSNQLVSSGGGEHEDHRLSRNDSPSSEAAHCRSHPAVTVDKILQETGTKQENPRPDTLQFGPGCWSPNETNERAHYAMRYTALMPCHHGTPCQYHKPASAVSTFLLTEPNAPLMHLGASQGSDNPSHPPRVEAMMDRKPEKKLSFTLPGQNRLDNRRAVSKEMMDELQGNQSPTVLISDTSRPSPRPGHDAAATFAANSLVDIVHAGGVQLPLSSLHVSDSDKMV